MIVRHMTSMPFVQRLLSAAFLQLQEPDSKFRPGKDSFTTGIYHKNPEAWVSTKQSNQAALWDWVFSTYYSSAGLTVPIASHFMGQIQSIGSEL